MVGTFFSGAAVTAAAAAARQLLSTNHPACPAHLGAAACLEAQQVEECGCDVGQACLWQVVPTPWQGMHQRHQSESGGGQLKSQTNILQATAAGKQRC